MLKFSKVFGSRSGSTIVIDIVIIYSVMPKLRRQLFTRDKKISGN